MVRRVGVFFCVVMWLNRFNSVAANDNQLAYVTLEVLNCGYTPLGYSRDLPVCSTTPENEHTK
jgi:hypothetical protein